MTLTTPAAPPAGAAAAAPVALTWRRWALVLSPVIGGALLTAGVAIDPGAGLTGREMYEAYGAEAGPMQVHSNLLHWGYGLWGISALVISGLVRGKGAWLANLAFVFGFAGIITLPGLLFIDFYDSAITQVYGADGALEVTKVLDQMWVVAAFAIPGSLGLIIGPVLAAIALARAGLARWWAPVLVFMAFVAFNVSGSLWWGGLIMTGLLGVYAAVLYGATR